jgi:hypothetical protein
MSCEVFVPYKPRVATLEVIERANAIIGEYQAQGFTLTLRQLFYQLVARELLPNTHKEYKHLGRTVRDARDGGLIDWDAIEDRTRRVNTHSSWSGPADIIESAARSFRIDPWEGQRYRPEVWIEKDALLGVIEGICTEYRVPYFAHRGNNSQTLQYEAGKRFAGYLDQGLIPVVLHLADHDPNGIDMTRDNIERLKLYTRVNVEVRRIALNMDQIERHRPPPSFVKEGDARTGAYRERFGTDECWELDALSPTVLADLIRDELVGLIDPKAWDKAVEREKRERDLLDKLARNWTKVKKALGRREGG